MTTEKDAAWVRDRFGESVIGGADPWATGEVAYEYLPDAAGHLVRPIDAETAGKIAELLASWHPVVQPVGDHYRVVIPRPAVP